MLCFKDPLRSAELGSPGEEGGEGKHLQLRSCIGSVLVRGEWEIP